MLPLDAVFAALRRSSFRQRFRLGSRERTYLETNGLPKVLEHASVFVAQRLAPAAPKNDGKQTPWRGHPVFVAQHATATCCRSCLANWHRIPKVRALTDHEQRHIVAAIGRWLSAQEGSRAAGG